MSAQEMQAPRGRARGISQRARGGHARGPAKPRGKRSRAVRGTIPYVWRGVPNKLPIGFAPSKPVASEATQTLEELDGALEATRARFEEASPTSSRLDQNPIPPSWRELQEKLEPAPEGEGAGVSSPPAYSTVSSLPEDGQQGLCWPQSAKGRFAASVMAYRAATGLRTNLEAVVRRLPAEPTTGRADAGRVQPVPSTSSEYQSQRELFFGKDICDDYTVKLAVHDRPRKGLRNVASGDAYFRLRPRGVQTRILQRIIGRVVDKSSPSVTVSEWARETLPEGAKVVKVHKFEVVNRAKSEPDKPHVEVVHELIVRRTFGETAVRAGTTAESRLYVELAAFLQAYATLRPRSVSLLSSLRARAVTWCLDRDIPHMDMSMVLPPAVDAAFRVREGELVVNASLGTRQSALGFAAMKSLSQGKPGLGSVPWFRSIIKPARWLFGDPLGDMFVSSFDSK